MVNRQKIMIVDDDENIAELISLYLTKECFNTRIVHDGESAMREFDTYGPNLVLLDLMLPGMDGFIRYAANCVSVLPCRSSFCLQRVRCLTRYSVWNLVQMIT